MATTSTASPPATATPAQNPVPVLPKSDGEVFAYSGLTVATLCWASAFIAGKVALAEMTPLSVGAWRYALASAVLLPFALRTQIRWANVPVAPLLVMIVGGGLVYPWLFLVALQNTSATNASLLIALNPAFTLLLSPLIGERIDGRRCGGLVLALAGAVIVITRGHPAQVLDMVANPLNNGDILALIAAGCWACFNLASRRVVTAMPPSAINGLVFGAGSIALFLIAQEEGPFEQLANASRAAWQSIAVMSLLSSVLAGQFFLSGVRTVGVNRSVVFVYLVPVLTALLSALLLGEAFHASQAIGGAAVLSGVYLTTRPTALRAAS